MNQSALMLRRKQNRILTCQFYAEKNDVNVKRYRWKSSIEILQISSKNLSDGPPTRSIKRVYCLFEICYSEGLSLAVGDVYDI